jgi:ATP-dependent exoDNAse (exonuclease V) alpha subunit
MLQAEALTILKTGANVFLTGEPGAGKTHTINEYIAYLRARGIEPSVTASTGIAATHVNGMTIHSWSGIGIRRELSEWDLDTIMSREKTVERIARARVLIIDEISMLDAKTLSMVDKVLRAARRSASGSRPFGGLQVIFVGDFFQLPPVSRESEGLFAFASRAWEDANPIVCYLSEQHRQADDAFLGVLGAIRSGEVETEHIELLEARLSASPTRVTPTRLHTHNADVDRLNTQSLSKIDKTARVYTMQSHGSQSLVESLKRSCLSPERLELKEGAAVMFTRNNFDAGYVNGTLGTIERIATDGVPTVRTFDGRLIHAETAEWSVQDGSRVLARVTQVPLRLAWAITVHKSQGMSLDAAIVDLSRAFEYGQGYVAISRVRSLSGLFLEGLNRRALELHPLVVEQDRMFRDASRAAQRKFASLKPEEVSALHKSCITAFGGKDVNAHAKDVQKQKAALGKYPNAGKGWSADDDLLLRGMFADKKPVAAMASHFGRKPSAIRARLGHFGLIKDFWSSKEGKVRKKD